MKLANHKLNFVSASSLGVVALIVAAIVGWWFFSSRETVIAGDSGVHTPVVERHLDRADKTNQVPVSIAESHNGGISSAGNAPLSLAELYKNAVHSETSSAEEKWKAYGAAEKCYSVMLGGEDRFLADWRQAYGKPGEQLPTEVTNHLKACAGFSDMRAVLMSDMNALLRTAADSGSLSARLRLLSMALASGEQVPTKEASVLLAAAFASQDPAALWELAGAMANTEGAAEGSLGPFSGLPQHEYAWQLAACASGYSCGPQSDVLQSVCVMGGYCGYASYEAFLQSVVLSPAEYTDVLRVRQQLMQRIASDYSSLLPPKG